MNDSEVGKRIRDELEETRRQFHALLGSLSAEDWDAPSRNPAWTNGQLVFHMLFAFMLIPSLFWLVRFWSRLPDSYSRAFARALDFSTPLFNRVNADIYCLEYDSPRAGDFAPLRFVPKGKTVILGLVSTKTPVLESKDALKRRIADAAAHVPLERLGLSPQCGFSSGGGGGQVVGEDDTRRKLDLVIEVAREVWG